MNKKASQAAMKREQKLDEQRQQRRQQVERENAEWAAQNGVAREDLSFLFA